MDEKNMDSLQETTKLKILQTFSKLDSSISQICKRIDQVDCILKSVEERASRIQNQIHMEAIRGKTERVFTNVYSKSVPPSLL